MKSTVAAACLLTIGWSSAACPRAAAGQTGYALRKEIRLHLTGVAGARLQLLEDDRIGDAVRGEFERGLPDDACTSPGTRAPRDFCASVARKPLRRALVRLVDARGSLLDTLSVERPIADIRLTIPAIGSQPPVYGVDFDMSADAGSYSGPLVEALDMRDGRLSVLRARDVAADSSRIRDFPGAAPNGGAMVVRRQASGRTTAHFPIDPCSHDT